MNACIIYAAISDEYGTYAPKALCDIAVEPLDLYCKNYVNNSSLRNRQILKSPIYIKATLKKNIRTLSTHKYAVPEHLIDFEEGDF